MNVKKYFVGLTLLNKVDQLADGKKDMKTFFSSFHNIISSREDVK